MISLDLKNPNLLHTKLHGNKIPGFPYWKLHKEVEHGNGLTPVLLRELTCFTVFFHFHGQEMQKVSRDLCEAIVIYMDLYL